MPQKTWRLILWSTNKVRQIKYKIINCYVFWKSIKVYCSFKMCAFIRNIPWYIHYCNLPELNIWYILARQNHLVLNRVRRSHYSFCQDLLNLSQPDLKDWVRNYKRKDNNTKVIIMVVFSIKFDWPPVKVSVNVLLLDSQDRFCCVDTLTFLYWFEDLWFITNQRL